MRLEYAEAEPEDEDEEWAIEIAVQTGDPNMVKRIRRAVRQWMGDDPDLAAVPRKGE